jgi:hypothetical protein
MHLHGRQPGLHASHVGQPAQACVRLSIQRIRLTRQRIHVRTTRISRLAELGSQRRGRGTDGL